MENVTWFGHASLSFVDVSSGKKIYYVDPFQLSKNRKLEKADIIFITHAHHDHLSRGDIDSLLKPDTVVVATPDSFETLKIKQEKFPVLPNKQYELNGFEFETVPAYNIKPQRIEYHPQKNNWVGYIFDINMQRFYIAGDTDFIPEMNELSERHIDVAFLPIGGTYTMAVDEAIMAANAIKAKKVIPIHYKMLLEGKAKGAEEKFKEGVKNSEVIFLPEFK